MMIDVSGLKKVVEQSGIAIYVKDGSIFVKNNKREYKIIDLKRMPISLGGMLEFNIENAMAACGSLVALGIDYCMISKGFRTFKLNNNHNSGRFNIYDLDGVKIILDYGHNVEGYKAILSSICKMKKRKLIGVIGMPGDRRDGSVIDIGELCGKFLDLVIIKEDKDRRGRRTGEISKLLEEGVKKSGVCKDYKIKLDETIDINEFYDKYEVIERRDKIWVIEDKEIEDNANS